MTMGNAGAMARACTASASGSAERAFEARVTTRPPTAGIRGRRPNDRRAALARDLLDDGRRVRLERSEHDRNTGLDDAGLLDGDAGERVSEVELVIERDRTNRRRDNVGRRENVRRVEPAAEADFDDGDLDPRTPEQLERHRGGDFEEGRLHLEAEVGAQAV